MSEKKTIVSENVTKIDEPEFKIIVSEDLKKIEQEIKENGGMTFNTKRENNGEKKAVRIR